MKLNKKNQMIIVKTDILKSFSILLIVIASVSAITERKEMTCHHIDANSWQFVGVVQTCWTGEETKITSTNDTVYYRTTSINDTDNKIVQAVAFDSNSEVFFLPNGLKETYPNLKVLSLFRQPIQTLHSDKMLQFGDDLQVFRAYKCHLTFIAANLFEHNGGLKYIDLSKNPLKHIEEGFLENVSKMLRLQQLELINSGCIDKQAKKSHVKGVGKWAHNCGKTKNETL